MRRLLCGALLVGGCFNPNGTSTTAASAGSTTSGTSEPMNTTAETTPGSTAGEVTSSSTDGMSAAQGVTTDTPTTSAITTMATTSTSGPTTDVTTTTTAVSTTSTGNDTDNSMTGADCNPACGACQTCEAGVCVQAAPGAPCPIPDDACKDLVWGPEDNACYGAAATDAGCDAGGECKPVCNGKGTLLAQCNDAACIQPINGCVPNAPAAGVTDDTYCVHAGVTPDCTTLCHKQIGLVEGYSCQQGGTCVLAGSQDCNGYSCDEQTLTCDVLCTGPLDCAVGFMCVMGQCLAG